MLTSKRARKRPRREHYLAVSVLTIYDGEDPFWQTWMLPTTPPSEERKQCFTPTQCSYIDAIYSNTPSVTMQLSSCCSPEDHCGWLPWHGVNICDF